MYDKGTKKYNFDHLPQFQTAIKLFLKHEFYIQCLSLENEVAVSYVISSERY